MIDWNCTECDAVISTFSDAPVPTCECGAPMEVADDGETQQAKSTDWLAVAKTICVDPFDDEYFDRERRYFDERDDQTSAHDDRLDDDE